MSKIKNEPQLPMNSVEHYLYCIIERLDALLEARCETCKLGESEAEQIAETKAKRTRKAKVEE